MDINYILHREQVSLHMAQTAASGPARLAHAGMAKAYGRLLADSPFPYRQSIQIDTHPIDRSRGGMLDE